MSRPCTICTSPDREQIETSIVDGASQRETGRLFGFSAGTVASHRKHSDLTPTPAPVTVAGGHLAAATALCSDFRKARGTEFSSQDEAEFLHLTSVASAVDADPSNTALLRELRLSYAAHRRNAEDSGHADGLSLAQFLAAAVAEARDS